MSIMKGKKGIVMGVANERSIAWGIANILAQQGAEIAFTYQNEGFKKRLVPLMDSIKSNMCFECDVSQDKNDENSIPLINIIPQPLEITSSDGYFELNEFTGIIYDDDFKVSGDFLKSYLRTGLNKELNGPHKIQFIQDLNLSPEAYVLNIKKKSIDITMTDININFDELRISVHV